jgi:beta-glucosidase-like glycosyl hydrolase
MHATGRLLFPALRWSPVTGFDHERAVIDAALDAGAGGFCLFGGDAVAVSALTSSLRERSQAPLLVGSDLERGAGQQFPQATQLPPLAAIGYLDDLALTRRAGALTAREALALGVNWVFAPVADVDFEPRNPIVGTRAFGKDPVRVAAHVAAWVEGCRSEGAACCVKHFPGHGRTTEDSHTVLPRVAAAPDLMEEDLRPFRAAAAAGVDAVMTAHVVYEALDPGAPATLSARILNGLLREGIGFDGLIATDALNMAGVLAAVSGDEMAAATAAVNAGCDAVLYPSDVRVLAAALAAEGGGPEPGRVAGAVRRIDAAAVRAAPRTRGGWGAQEDVVWADDLALRSVLSVWGAPHARAACEVVTVDDDVGGPFPPPPRHTLAESLDAGGVDVRIVDEPTGARPLVLAVYSDIRAWKGPPGLSPAAGARVRAAVERVPDATVILFGHPRLAAAVPGVNLAAAWGGEAIMQRAAARWLLRQG